MTTHTQLEIDINNWSNEKLHQWVVDTVHRYQMADLDSHLGVINSTINLMMMLAKLLSHTTIPADEAGAKFAESITMLRNRDKKSKQKSKR
jgi:hypothetical protein